MYIFTLLFFKLGLIQYKVICCVIFQQKCFPVTEKYKDQPSLSDSLITELIIMPRLDFYVMHLFMI